MVCGKFGSNFIMQDGRAYICSSYTNGGEHLCGNKVRLRKNIAETVLLARVKERLLSNDVIGYVSEQIRKAVDSMSRDTDAANLEAQIEYLASKIEKLVEAIESIGISGTLVERLRCLEREKRDAEARLAQLSVDCEPFDAPPDLIPSLM